MRDLSLIPEPHLTALLRRRGFTLAEANADLVRKARIWSDHNRACRYLSEVNNLPDDYPLLSGMEMDEIGALLRSHRDASKAIGLSNV